MIKSVFFFFNVSCTLCLKSKLKLFVVAYVSINLSGVI